MRYDSIQTVHSLLTVGVLMVIVVFCDIELKIVATACWEHFVNCVSFCYRSFAFDDRPKATCIIFPPSR